MVNNMAKSIGHLISLNGEYLYSPAHHSMYAPLRINDRIAQKIQKGFETKQPDEKSCIKTIAATWCDGRFLLATEFNQTTKCTATLLTTPSRQTKTEVCFRNLCNGRCTDDFMRNVLAKNILPELYNTKQK